MKTLLDAPVARVRGPEDLLHIIPTLVGFQPQESLVIVQVGYGRVQATIRCDLEWCEEPGVIEDLLNRLPVGVEHDETWSVLMVGYGPRLRVCEVAAGLRTRLGLRLTDALIVDEGRWWRLDDPVHWTGVAVATDGLDDYEWAARPPAPSRESLQGQMAAPRGEREDELLALALDLLASDADEGPAHDPTPISDDDRSLMGAVLHAGSPACRDALWATLTRENASSLLTVWMKVLASAPMGLRVAPLCVTGMIAWVAGEGAIANMCLEEAERIDPGFSLVSLLRMVSINGLHPSVWTDLKVDMEADSESD